MKRVWREAWGEHNMLRSGVNNVHVVPSARVFEERKLIAQQYRCTVRFWPEVKPLKQVRINGVKYAKGSWLCTRSKDVDNLEPIRGVRAGLPHYAPPRQMWFGRVRHMFLHRRAIGDCEALVVDWHQSVPLPKPAPLMWICSVPLRREE